MNHPHDLYLVFLLSQRCEAYEIQVRCKSYFLPEPTIPELDELRQGLGAFPACWARSLAVTNTDFGRWLRAHGLLDLWRDTDAVRGAFQILRSTHLRRSVEGMLLLSPNQARCREALAEKFRTEELPSAESIATFRALFWDFSAMPSGVAFKYITDQKEHYKDRPEVHYGLTRDERTVRAAVGLPLPAESDVTLISKILSHISQRVDQVSRDVDGNDPRGRAEVASYAASVPRLLETLEKAKKKNETGSVATIRMRMAQSKIRAIPSIDDIQRSSEVIDGRPTGTNGR